MRFIRSSRSTKDAAQPPRYTSREVTAIVAVGVLIAALVPVGVQAAGSLVTLVDPSSNLPAKVDTGNKLRVGDGSGALTVDGTLRVRDASGALTVDQPAAGILATGDCDLNSDGEASSGTVANSREITGILLSAENDNQYPQARLMVTAPSATEPLMGLLTYSGTDGNGQQIQYVPFDPPLRSGALGSWSFSCGGPTIGLAGAGRWAVFGR